MKVDENVELDNNNQKSEELSKLMYNNLVNNLKRPAKKVSGGKRTPFL